MLQMLYYAIYVPPETEPPPLAIIKLPEIRQYATNFGNRDGDMGILAFENDSIIGMSWIRLIHGYGYVDDETPELTIAIIPESRGKGVGTMMLRQLMQDASPHYSKISLSVQLTNPAYKLYQRIGFTDYRVNDTSVTMVLKLDSAF